MKKLFSILLLSFVCLTFTIPAIAQGTDPADPDPIDIPGYFVSLATVASLGLLLTALVTKKLTTNPVLLGLITVKQLISWVICILIAFVGYWMQIGMFIGLSVGWTIIIGVASGLAANGTYDIKIIQAVLEFIKFKYPQRN